MKKSLLLLFTLLFTTAAWGQVPLRPADLVQHHKNLNQSFVDVSNVLTAQTASVRNRPELQNEVSKGVILDFNAENARQIGSLAPKTMTMVLPVDANNSIEVELVKVNILSPEFRVTTSEGQTINPELGTHYRGVIKGQDHSLAAVSFYNDQVVGMFSTQRRGNFVLGPLNGANPNREHIVYNDSDLLINSNWECHTPDDGLKYSPEQLQPTASGRALSDCIRIYYEVDYDIYTNKGTGTSAFVTAEFNQIATLYANESLNYLLNEIYINTTSGSAYSNGSSSSLLSQFKSRISSLNGANLGHLITYRSSGGIAAGFSGLCNSNVDNSLCISDIQGTYSNVPTYSWDIMVQTHEMGHLNGSRHTHACVWNGNNTAIDGCSGSTEGSCPLPGNPSNGGTLMSYCHLQSVGINFSNGFGPQPGNVIRNATTNASCLSACDGGGDECTSTITSFPYTENYEGSLTWAQSSADDFDWTRQTGGTPSSGTGPAAAGQGSYYAYMEVSSPNYPSRSAIITSPCFNLTSVSDPEISFQYHATGTAVGTLLLQASTDGTNWSTIWSISGDQGTAWLSANVSLSAYTNDTEVRLRFNGTSGSSWSGDLCVDDITVGEAGGSGGGQDYADIPYSTGFESGSFDQYWTTESSASVGRVQVTNGNGPSGSYHVTMDVTTNGTYSQNEARLGLKLAGKSNVNLTFDWKEFSDENHVEDGVFLSDNGGASYTKVYDLTNGTSTYQTINLDISALASANGLSLTNTFIVKFQQYDNYAITTDGHAIDNISVTEGTTGGCPEINFNSYTVGSYGSGQDGGSSAIQDAGATLFLQQNAWKSITYNYTVTANTVIEFDFRSTAEGEIHGIGFDSDDAISSNLTFQVHGTQNWGLLNYNNYSPTAWTTYTIPVGSFYTGTFNRLFFVCDNDAAPTTGTSYFRSVKIYESSCNAPAALGAQPAGPIEAILGTQGEFSFDVFPMPVIDRMITSLEAADGVYPAEISDLTGKIVWKGDVLPRQQAHDISDLPAGMYLLKVTLGPDQMVTRKIVKQN